MFIVWEASVLIKYKIQSQHHAIYLKILSGSFTEVYCSAEETVHDSDIAEFDVCVENESEMC